MPGDQDQADQQAQQEQALKAKILQLQTELDKVKQEKDKPYVYTRERKIAVFSSDCDVSDWVRTVQAHVESRFKEEKERTSFVLEHLSSAARTEVRFELGEKSSSGEILDFILTSFGVKDTVIELQRTFYNREQRPEETLREYMLALMEIMNTILLKEKSFTKERSKMLKFKFAEGVMDVSLRRELKRLNEERESLSANELRQHATAWMESSSPVAPVSAVSAASSASVNGDLLSRLSAQERQLREVTELLKNLKAPSGHNAPIASGVQDSRSNADNSENRSANYSKVQCSYCKRFGHVKAKCFKLQRKNSTQEGSRTHVQKNETWSADLTNL